jgi:hypothetical protein
MMMMMMIISIANKNRAAPALHFSREAWGIMQA